MEREREKKSRARSHISSFQVVVGFDFVPRSLRQRMWEKKIKEKQKQPKI